MNETVFNVGILVTAGLAVIGYFFKLGLERRETARTLLFHLLEIRHVLLIEGPKLNSLVDDFEAEMNQLVGNRPLLKSTVADQIPRAQITNLLASMFDGLVRVDQGFIESYEAALFSYSRVDPVLCHKVRGMKLLPKASSNVTNFALSFEEMVQENRETKVIMELGKKEIQRSKETIVGELISTLEEMIRGISCRAGIDFWFRVRWLLKVKSEKKEVDETGKFNTSQLMERLFKEVIVANCPSEEMKLEVEALTLEQVLDLFEFQLAQLDDHYTEHHNE